MSGARLRVRSSFTRRLRRIHPARAVAAGCAIAVITLVVAGSAQAALSLTTTAAPTFAVTLDGTDQSPAFTLPVSVADTTSPGDGWRVSVTSTPFSTGGSAPRLLPDTASAITAVTASCAVAPCTEPVNSVQLPVGVPAGTGPPGAVPFFNAAAGSGTGEFTVTPTVRVTVPANAYAGTYASTLTLSVVSGP